MDVISFLYTIFLLLLYACVISSCFYAWMNTGHKLYLHLIALFVFFLFDLSVISIIEFIYHTPGQFSPLPSVSFPLLRNVGFFSGMIIYTFFFLCLMERSFELLNLIPLLIYAACMVVFGTIRNSAAADWMYFTTRYVTIISLLFLLRIQIRACGDRIDVQRRVLALQLNLFILVFMCLSFVENTVTTMYWKEYSGWLNSFAPRLSERIFCEDMYSVILSYWCLTQCYDVIKNKLNTAVLPVNMSSALPKDRYDSAKEEFAQKLGLTKREREILDLLLKDMTNQEISGELVISLGTVKTHVHNILQKAEVTKRTQLMEQFRNFVQK